MRDIATNKAFTLGRRPKWRDYVDLYFSLNGGYISIVDLVNLSRKKFGSDFSEKLFLEELVYWGDVSDYTIEFVERPVSPDKIKLFLESETKKFKKRLLG